MLGHGELRRNKDGIRAERPGSITGKCKKCISSPQGSDYIRSHPASYVYWGLFQRTKVAGSEADDPLPTSGEMENSGSNTHTSPYIFMACLVNYRHNFTLLTFASKN
jgi:hypothetical protein